MKLDFLPDGSPDCPLVRIYGFGPAEARGLHEAVARLAGGKVDSVEIHSLAGAEPVDGCRLTLRVGRKDRGVCPVPGKNSLECVLRRHTWEQVADRIAPFCEEAAPGHYQWLDESGDIPLLLSASGDW